MWSGVQSRNANKRNKYLMRVMDRFSIKKCHLRDLARKILSRKAVRYKSTSS